MANVQRECATTRRSSDMANNVEHILKDPTIYWVHAECACTLSLVVENIAHTYPCTSVKSLLNLTHFAVTHDLIYPDGRERRTHEIGPSPKIVRRKRVFFLILVEFFVCASNTKRHINVSVCIFFASKKTHTQGT